MGQFNWFGRWCTHMNPRSYVFFFLTFSAGVGAIEIETVDLSADAAHFHFYVIFNGLQFLRIAVIGASCGVAATTPECRSPVPV